MSRTGKKPIPPISGVTVAINDRVVTAKGPKGEQSLTLMVTVTLDTISQIQSHLIAQQYEGLVKRSRLGGRRQR